MMGRIFDEARAIPSGLYHSMCVNYGQIQNGNVELVDGLIPSDEQLTAHFVCYDRKTPQRKLFVGSRLTIKDRVKGKHCVDDSIEERDYGRYRQL